MIPVLSADEIRKWDAYTIQHEPISSIDLMERAALACSRWIMEHYPYTQPFSIICGNGNNGGDGLAIARHLIQASYPVQIFISNSEKRSADNLHQLNRLQQIATTPIFLWNELHHMDDHSVIIDALLGTGLKEEAKDDIANIIEFINRSGQTVISIDLPSGLLADEVRTNPTLVHAHDTLTFQCYKSTFVSPEHGQACGHVTVLDIKLHLNYLDTCQPKRFIVEASDIDKIKQPRHAFGHKGNYGHALILAGSLDKLGACLLATKACLRSGAGLVTALAPEDHTPWIPMEVPEAMTLSREAIVSRNNLEVYNAIGIGPGLGTNDDALAMLKNIIALNKPIILDADAINLIGLHPDLLKLIPNNSLLTPHVKEFDRVFGVSKDSQERYSKQQEASTKYKIFILLKGKNSTLTTPDGKTLYNNTGNPGMATAGSGDVLTGIITGLFAQYQDMEKAAMMGMYVHGEAGDAAANKRTEASMIASDIIDALRI